jgi:hypothetical protein
LSCSTFFVIVLSVLLRFTDSDYPFVIDDPFIYLIKCRDKQT